jgi:hypothetical protein
MVGNIYSLVATYLKVQALKSSSTFNPEVRGQNRVREAIAKLIQQSTADHIIMGDQETAVMFAIYVVRQPWVYNVSSKIFSVDRAYTCCFEVITWSTRASNPSVLDGLGTSVW